MSFFFNFKMAFLRFQTNKCTCIHVPKFTPSLTTYLNFDTNTQNLSFKGIGSQNIAPTAYLKVVPIECFQIVIQNLLPNAKI
jgi:hypothetical protein